MTAAAHGDHERARVAGRCLDHEEPLRERSRSPGPSAAPSGDFAGDHSRQASQGGDVGQRFHAQEGRPMIGVTDGVGGQGLSRE
jgi:hypothetical protein